MKRFAVTMSFYINAEDDKSAIEKAKYIATQQDSKKDDSCSVDEVRIAEFARLDRKVIYPTQK